MNWDRGGGVRLAYKTGRDGGERERAREEREKRR